jgi:hypothetical protein
MVNNTDTSSVASGGNGNCEHAAIPEMKREKAEAGREVAEDKREGAEDDRTAGERQRQHAEEARESAEDARQSAEAARSSAEEARIAREEARDMLEASRKLFEQIEHKRTVAAAAMKAALLAAKTHNEASAEHSSALKDQKMLEALWNMLVNDDPPEQPREGALRH